MPFKHEYHLLLWFLEQTSQFDSHLIRQFIEKWVFLLDEFDKQAYFSLEIVETFAYKHSIF